MELIIVYPVYLFYILFLSIFLFNDLKTLTEDLMIILKLMGFGCSSILFPIPFHFWNANIFWICILGWFFIHINLLQIVGSEKDFVSEAQIHRRKLHTLLSLISEYLYQWLMGDTFLLCFAIRFGFFLLRFETLEILTSKIEMEFIFNLRRRFQLSEVFHHLLTIIMIYYYSYF